MGLFKNQYEKAMDDIIKHIDANMSNNYKDAAQANFREFEELYNKLCEQGVLKEKVKTAYGEKLAEYRTKMQGFTHKDQKPYWT